MDTNTLLDFLSEYSVVVGNTAYPRVLFIWVFLLLTAIMVIRVINWKLQDKTRTKKQMVSFGIRQIPCFLFAMIISFTLTCIFGINSNKILNGFICPGIGYIASIIFDEKYLSKSMKKYTSNSTDESKEKESIPSQIVVNIDNTNEKEIDEDEFEYNDDYEGEDYLHKPDVNDFITDRDLSEKYFHEKVQNKINSLIYARYVSANELMKMNHELSDQTHMLSAICESIKDERKLELEKLIYACLVKGYATPDENKVITTKYHNYKSLGGNGDIQELYEKHYLLLPIREEKTYNTDKYIKKD